MNRGGRGSKKQKKNDFKTKQISECAFVDDIIPYYTRTHLQNRHITCVRVFFEAPEQQALKRNRISESL